MEIGNILKTGMKAFFVGVGLTAIIVLLALLCLLIGKSDMVHAMKTSATLAIFAGSLGLTAMGFYKISHMRPSDKEGKPKEASSLHDLGRTKKVADIGGRKGKKGATLRGKVVALVSKHFGSWQTSTLLMTLSASVVITSFIFDLLVTILIAK